MDRLQVGAARSGMLVVRALRAVARIASEAAPQEARETAPDPPIRVKRSSLGVSRSRGDGRGPHDPPVLIE